MTVDSVLLDIFNRFIAIKDSEYQKQQNIFKIAFRQIKDKMGECSNYFKQYAKEFQIVGSVYDGIKVGKLDEFDVNIVIRLPISYENSERGILMENHSPGFVKLKIKQAFDDLDNRPDWESTHKVTRDWRDNEKYFLQNVFRSWMQKTVHRALNLMENRVWVDNVPYSINMKESGPAITLLLRRGSFALDVDLVPVIKFSHGSRNSRWPCGYRKPTGSRSRHWCVVPKPNMSIDNQKLKNRCWRISGFHDYEKNYMAGYDNLKCTIRLVKKLRDNLGMTKLASYYIKTVFLWEIEKQANQSYWQTGLAKLFEDMVQKLLEALENKTILYFWNSNYNLIENMRPSIQRNYCKKLRKVLETLERKDEGGIAMCLLTDSELEVYKSSQVVPQAVPRDVPQFAPPQSNSCYIIILYIIYIIIDNNMINILFCSILFIIIIIEYK